MDGIIENEQEYRKERGSVNDRLKMAHAQTKSSAEEVKGLKQDLQASTIEGRQNYLDHRREFDFAVANNLPAAYKLKLIHGFDSLRRFEK